MKIAGSTLNGLSMTYSHSQLRQPAQFGDWRESPQYWSFSGFLLRTV
jgi:hypothetical protein